MIEPMPNEQQKPKPEEDQAIPEKVKYPVCIEKHRVVDKKDGDVAISCDKQESDGAVVVKTFKPKMGRLVGGECCPIRCPLNGCNDIFFTDELLSHIFNNHSEDKIIKKHGMIEFHNKQKVLLQFKSSDLMLTKLACVGFLLYDPTYKKGPVLPSELPFCNGNTFLHPKHSKYKHHVPIMIIASLMTWSELLTCKPPCNQVKDDTGKVSDPSLMLVVIWLIGTKINKPFHMCVTLYSASMSHSKSSIIKVEPIYETQKPYKFLRGHSNYILLTKGELDLMSNNGRNKINIELIPNEEDVE